MPSATNRTNVIATKQKSSAIAEKPRDALSVEIMPPQWFKTSQQTLAVIQKIKSGQIFWDTV